MDSGESSDWEDLSPRENCDTDPGSGQRSDVKRSVHVPILHIYDINLELQPHSSPSTPAPSSESSGSPRGLQVDLVCDCIEFYERMRCLKKMIENMPIFDRSFIKETPRIYMKQKVTRSICEESVHKMEHFVDGLILDLRNLDALEHRGLASRTKLAEKRKQLAKEIHSVYFQVLHMLMFDDERGQYISPSVPRTTNPFKLKTTKRPQLYVINRYQPPEDSVAQEEKRLGELQERIFRRLDGSNKLNSQRRCEGNPATKIQVGDIGTCKSASGHSFSSLPVIQAKKLWQPTNSVHPTHRSLS